MMPRLFSRALRLATAIVALALNACAEPTAALQEQSRLAAPGGRVEAVLAAVGGDATTGQAVELHLLPTGESRYAAPSLRADKVAGLRLHWRDGHTLVISCDAARIFAFSNFWQSASVDNFHYTVALELDGCRYPAAPDKDKS